MNYENMSDFEINKRVAEFRGGFGGSTNNEYAPDEVVCFDDKPFHTERDYCNNPSDAWPIISENKIGGHWGKAAPGAYFAVSRLEEFVVMHKNPLRAACIVYLMMQGAGE